MQRTFAQCMEKSRVSHDTYRADGGSLSCIREAICFEGKQRRGQQDCVRDEIARVGHCAIQNEHGLVNPVPSQPKNEYMIDTSQQNFVSSPVQNDITLLKVSAFFSFRTCSNCQKDIFISMLLCFSIW